MFQTLKQHWQHFLRRPAAQRFQDVHERHQTHSGKRHAGKQKLLMISGGVIALLGLMLLPLPGPGSVILAAGLILLAAESMVIARMLDWADQKRARLLYKLHRRCQRLGPRRCALLGTGIGVVLAAAGMALWLWLTG